MAIIADTHVHLYPCYDLGRALRGAVSSLVALGPGADGYVACLTERADCHFFAGLRSGEIRAEGVTVAPGTEPEAVTVSVPGKPDLHLLAGRQIVPRERIEVLALTTDAEIPDGLPAREVVTRVRDAGGLAVLSWAPGKWFGARGDVVRDVLDASKPGDVLVGDTSLRPVGWGEPRLIREARQRGCVVIAGSDPLPFAGDDRYAGTYGSRMEAAFDAAKPVASFRVAVSGSVSSVGRRCGPLSWMLRLWGNHRAKRGS